MRRNKKVYIDNSTGEETTSSSIALQWHKSGASLTVKDCITNKLVKIPGGEKAEPYDEEYEALKSLSERLDAYVFGLVRKCPECGGSVIPNAFNGRKHKCILCGMTSDLDLYEWCDVSEFLERGFCTEYRVWGRGYNGYRSVRLKIHFGRQMLYIDTDSRDVYRIACGKRYRISDEAVNAINEWAKECWNNMV